ncbi:MAG: hypothetical protein AAFO94_19480 [Bacteroidota bacterium]
MSKKNTDVQNGPALGLGEISTIRNILMGQHINDFEARFKETEKRINKMEDNLLNKMQEMKEKLQDADRQLSKEMNQQFDSFGKRMEKEVEELERKLEKATTKDRHNIGKLLGEVSKKLLAE